MGMTGLCIIIFMLLFSFVGPEIYRTNQITNNIFKATLPPSGHYPLGTDAVGYNVLGRLMVAGQSSLEVGFAAAAIAAIFGTLWGATAGYLGGRIDSAMMRVVDSFLAIPSLLLVLLLASFVSPSVVTMILILGSISWLATARLGPRRSLGLAHVGIHPSGRGAWSAGLAGGDPSPRAQRGRHRRGAGDF